MEFSTWRLWKTNKATLGDRLLKKWIAKGRCCWFNYSFGAVFHKEFSLGSGYPLSHWWISVLVGKWSAGSPNLTFLFDLSAFSRFSLLLVASHRAYKCLWSPLLQAQESSMQLHSFQKTFIYCMRLACKVLSWVLNVKRGLCILCMEPKFPLSLCVPASTQWQAPRHLGESSARLWVTKFAYYLRMRVTI